MLNTPIHPSRPAQADDTGIEAIVESGPRGCDNAGVELRKGAVAWLLLL